MNPVRTAMFWFWEAGRGQSQHWCPFLKGGRRFSRRLKKIAKTKARHAAKWLDGPRGQAALSQLYESCVKP